MVGACLADTCHTNAVQVAVLCGSTDILSAEGCGTVAEGSRFDCSQYGSFVVFAIYLRFPVVVLGCRTAENHRLTT